MLVTQKESLISIEGLTAGQFVAIKKAMEALQKKGVLSSVQIEVLKALKEAENNLVF